MPAELDSQALGEYRRGAEKKLAGVPAQEAAEAERAAIEGRKPHKVQPFNEVDPAVLGPVMAMIQVVPDGLAETVGTISRVCRTQRDPFCMRSDQLVAILDAAGITD